MFVPSKSNQRVDPPTSGRRDRQAISMEKREEKDKKAGASQQCVWSDGLMSMPGMQLLINAELQGQAPITPISPSFNRPMQIELRGLTPLKHGP